MALTGDKSPFELERDQALGVIRDTGTDWTDHNYHDSGITLLEAMLWGLVDQDFRTSGKSFAGWSAWTGARAGDPEAARPDAHFDTLLNSQRGDLEVVLDRAGSLDEATARVAAVAGAAGHSLDPGQARTLTVWLRRERTDRAAFDLGHLLARAVRPEPGLSEAKKTERRLALFEALAALGLWPDEMQGLDAIGLRRVVADLLETVTRRGPGHGALADLVAAAVDRHGLTEEDALLVAARTAVPEALPEAFENDTGNTRVFPPHPLQARTVEPVLAADYLRRAVVTRIKRAWLVKGVGRGIDWKGAWRDEPVPDRQGAFTLVIQPNPDDTPDPEDATAIAGFLRSCLDDVLGSEDHTVTGPGAPYRDVARNMHNAAPRRLVGDEIGAALVCHERVSVRAVLMAESGTRLDRVRADAVKRLERFLSADRQAPFIAPPEPVPAPAGPGEVDGPWPWKEPFVPGWEPGTPIRVNEVVQLLAGVSGVIGVEQVAVATVPTDTEDDWQTALLAVGPYCVPQYVDSACLQVVRVEGGNGGA